MGLVNQPTLDQQPADPGQPNQELNLRSDVVDYFKSVAQSRAGMDRLSVIAGATLFILAIDTYALWLFVNEGLGSPPVTVPQAMPWLIAHLACIGFCALVYVVAHLHKLLYAHQAFFSTVFAILGLLTGYSVSLMGFELFAFSTYQYGSQSNLIAQTQFTLIIWAVTWSVAMVFYTLLLLRILRHGISRKFTMQNYGAIKKVMSSKSMGIIYACSILGTILGKANNANMTAILGMAGLIFFSLVMPVVPFEFGYLAYLKWRDRRFWQPTPTPQPFWTPLRKLTWIKRGTIAGIILLIFIILMAIGIYNSIHST